MKSENEIDGGEMRVTTWNINGIRSLPQTVAQVLKETNSDIACFQETKIPRDALESQVALVDGYNSFYSFCRKKAGYSGVATYCSSLSCPHSSEETFFSSNAEKDISDYEGRVMITRHKFRRKMTQSKEESVYLFNMYCPRFDPDNPERFSYKMSFHRLMEERVKEILTEGHHVLLTGDLNIARSEMDHCDSSSIPDFHDQEHRVWLKKLLGEQESSGAPILIDLFRNFHPNEERAYTCWNTKISARETNFGTRIDYFIADRALVDEGFFLDCYHIPDYKGSDHCPVQCVIDTGKFEFIPPDKIPPTCTKFLPELRGSQTSLKAFLAEPAQKISGLHKQDSSSAPVVSKKRIVKTPCTIDKFFKPPTKTNDCPQVPKKCTAEMSPFPLDVAGELPSFASQPLSCNDSAVPRPKKLKTEWAKVFKPPPPAPLCKGHSESCVSRTVKKKGPNLNKKFWVCARPEAHKGDPQGRCDHFQWH